MQLDFITLIDAPIVLVPLRARDGSVRAFAIIDEADSEWVNQWRWYLCKGYAIRAGWEHGRKQTIRLHRLLLGLTHGDGLEGDHLNRDRLDCRRANLRVTTTRGNSQNRSSHTGSTSKYRGVSWSRSNSKWKAEVTVNGKRTYLGHFISESEAAQIAREARSRLLPYATD